MRLDNGVIQPFCDFVENKEALPVGRIRGNFSTHWRFLFSEVLEEGLKEKGMELKFPPTATPEQLKEHFENHKVVLEHKVSCFCDGGKGLKNKVTTWASKCSLGQIEANGTASDEAKLGPRGNQNQKRKEFFNQKGTVKENALFK